MDIKEITGNWDYRTLPGNVQIGKDCWLERKESFARFKSHRQPGLIIGNVILLKVCISFAPRFMDASSKDMSKPIKDAMIVLKV